MHRGVLVGRLPLQIYSAVVKYDVRIGRARAGGGMRRLGVVENIAHDGTVLVRSDFAPSRGADVRDKRNRPLGRVIKAFEPGREPSPAVRPGGAPPLSLFEATALSPEGVHPDQ